MYLRQSYPASKPNNSFKPNLLRYSKSVAEKACHAFASTTQVGLTQALGAAMKLVSSLIALTALSGCAATSTPTPAELARNPSRYNDRQITTCGQITAGGGKCVLKAPAGEIWLSSASQLCASPAARSTHANISGTFLSLGSDAELVIRKAIIQPLSANCPSGGT